MTSAEIRLLTSGNVALIYSSQIEITMATIKKNFQINKNRILRDLDLLLKIWHQELNVYCLANYLREKQKNYVCLNSNKALVYFTPYIFN